MNIIKPVKTIVSISALCASLAFSSMSGAYASDNGFSFDGPGHHQKGKKMMKLMVKELSLTDAQQVQIKALKTQAKEQREVFRESMQKFKDAEKALVQAASFDEQAFTTLHTSYQDTIAQMALARAKTKNAIFNVLTTEQQEKWEEKMEERKEKGKRNKKG